LIRAGAPDFARIRKSTGGNMRTEIARAVLAGAVLLPNGASADRNHWWHSMQGALNDKLNELASGFNASQKEYKVVRDLQGTIPRVDDRGDRRVPCRQCADILQVSRSGPRP